MAGITRLDENLARLFAATRSPGCLGDLLESAFGGAQISAFKAEIGVDNADQSEFREMIAFGDQLRADDDIDCLVFDPARQILRL